MLDVVVLVMVVGVVMVEVCVTYLGKAMYVIRLLPRNATTQTVRITRLLMLTVVCLALTATFTFPQPVRIFP